MKSKKKKKKQREKSKPTNFELFIIKMTVCYLSDGDCAAGCLIFQGKLK